MIDCLYNITAILQNPSVKAYEFRASGYKLTLQALDADEQRYGLLPIALFLAPKDLPQEDRHTVDNAGIVMIATHIARLAGILLCTLTEIQAYCRFDGARINQRLHEIWNALIVVPEIKELHDERYANLMKERGINPE